MPKQIIVNSVGDNIENTP